MAENRLPITWNERLVGYIEDLKSDMPFLYGTWIPENTTVTQKFLTSLQQDEQLWVKVGNNISGTVEECPDEEIEVKHWPQVD